MLASPSLHADFDRHLLVLTGARCVPGGAGHVGPHPVAVGQAAGEAAAHHHQHGAVDRAPARAARARRHTGVLLGRLSLCPPPNCFLLAPTVLSCSLVGSWDALVKYLLYLVCRMMLLHH